LRRHRSRLPFQQAVMLSNNFGSSTTDQVPPRPFCELPHYPFGCVLVISGASEPRWFISPKIE